MDDWVNAEIDDDPRCDPFSICRGAEGGLQVSDSSEIVGFKEVLSRATPIDALCVLDSTCAVDESIDGPTLLRCEVHSRKVNDHLVPTIKRDLEFV